MRIELKNVLTVCGLISYSRVSHEIPPTMPVPPQACHGTYGRL